MISNDFIYFSLILTSDSKEKLEDRIFKDKIMQEIIKRKGVTGKFLHHCTLFHKDDNHPVSDQLKEYLYNSLKKRYEEEENKLYKIKVIGWGWNNKALALLVDKNSIELPRLEGHKYHITVCTFDNAKPFESNNISVWSLFSPIEVECVFTENLLKQ